MSGGSLRPPSFPFTAIYGLEEVKRAVLCWMVNPNIRNILLKGASGTAKTTIARSIADIAGGKMLVNVPISITDDRLFGAIDMESALNEGVFEIDKGLLSEADGNILYLDDINLFEKKTINSILDVIDTEKVIIERDGISSEYKCKTKMIASMNTSGPDLDRSTLDRFDICVNLDHFIGIEEREEILRRALAFQEDPVEFINSYEKEENDLKKRIEEAKDRVDSVVVSKKALYSIANVSATLEIAGHRGDLAIAHTCVSLAALDGKTEVSGETIKEASVMCLYHRRNKEAQQVDRKSISYIDHRAEDPKPRIENKGPPDDLPQDTDDHDGDARPSSDNADVPSTDIIDLPETLVSDISEAFESIDLMDFDKMKDMGSKRSTVTSKDRSGRYIGSRDSDKKNPDLAFDATIRSAAPYQIKRHGTDGRDGLVIKKQDLKEKIRKKRRRCTFMFMIDNSGSLIIKNRVAVVKSSIKSMLESHYVKRDRVGFMTFSERSIDIQLEPNRSVEMIFDLLDNMPVGSGTPLAQAIVTVCNYMRSYLKRHPDEICYIILVTDGKANIAIQEGADIIDELFMVAKTVNIPALHWVIIDSGIGYSKTDIPYELSNILGGTYFTLDELKVNPKKLEKIG